jgi:PHD/YefM family antitoxin component YafN of YafNO toxin-antitoxin module
MTAIFSSAALKTRQREIKDIARKDVVHITENGNAAFVFMSEELFEEQLNKAAEEATLTERMRACIRASDNCFDDDQCIEGTNAFFSALDERLATHG